MTGRAVKPIYTVSGRVSHGRAVGRKLGFRTINLPCPDDAPEDGVYVARVVFEGGDGYDAVLNQGAPPTFPGAPRRVEAHILGDCGDRYGAEATVEYLLFLRPQRDFGSPEALKAAILADEKSARDFFSRQAQGYGDEAPGEDTP